MKAKEPVALTKEVLLQGNQQTVLDEPFVAVGSEWKANHSHE